MVRSLFNPKIIFYILSATLISILLSFFILQILLLVLSIMWLTDLIIIRKVNFGGLSSIIILTLLITQILSSLFSDYSKISFNALIKESFFFLSYFSFTHYLYFINKDKKLSLLKIFLYGGLLIALIGIIKYNLGSLRAESITSGSATFSVFITVIFGMVIILKDKILIKKNILLETAVLAILLSAISLTFAKANIFIALLVLFVCFFLKRVKLNVVLASLVLTAFVVLFSMNNNTKYYTNNLKDESYLFSNRDLIWKGAFYIALEKPVLGHGVGTFKEIYPYWDQLKDKGVGNWHNQFIQVYMDTGIIGMLIFLFLIYHIYSNWFIMRKVKEENEDKIIINSLILGITSLLLTSLATNFISSVILSIVFTFMFSLLQSYKTTQYDTIQ